MEAMNTSGDKAMIAQSSGGFQSTYVASDKVRVISKNIDDEQSEQKETETVHGEVKRGTRSVSSSGKHFRVEGQDEFLVWLFMPTPRSFRRVRDQEEGQHQVVRLPSFPA